MPIWAGTGSEKKYRLAHRVDAATLYWTDFDSFELLNRCCAILLERLYRDRGVLGNLRRFCFGDSRADIYRLVAI